MPIARKDLVMHTPPDSSLGAPLGATHHIAVHCLCCHAHLAQTLLPTHREEVPDMRCGSCQRWLHALCCTPAALTPTEYPPDQAWTCPCCEANNTVSKSNTQRRVHCSAACSGAQHRHTSSLLRLTVTPSAGVSHFTPHMEAGKLYSAVQQISCMGAFHYQTTRREQWLRCFYGSSRY